MEIEKIAREIADRTKKEHDFEKCIRFALCFSEGLNIAYGIDEAEFIQLLTAHDSRFKDGYTKKRIILSNDKFNPNGAVYIGKNELIEAREAGDFAIFTIRGKGL